MSHGKEWLKLREAADAILEEHSDLLYNHGHDGAAHCKCPVAARYREADAACWEVRSRKPRISVTLEPNLVEFLQEYQKNRRLPSLTAAVESIVREWKAEHSTTEYAPQEKA